jgi:hypothetical protein
VSGVIPDRFSPAGRASAIAIGALLASVLALAVEALLVRPAYRRADDLEAAHTRVEAQNILTEKRIKEAPLLRTRQVEAARVVTAAVGSYSSTTGVVSWVESIKRLALGADIRIVRIDAGHEKSLPKVIESHHGSPPIEARTIEIDILAGYTSCRRFIGAIATLEHPPTVVALRLESIPDDRRFSVRGRLRLRRYLTRADLEPPIVD